MNSRNFIAFVLILFVIFGTGDARRAKRVLQGSDAVPGEFPYMVSLRRWNVHVCGGAIISSRHILTAAHCFVGRADAPYTEGLVVITGASTNRTIGQVHRAKTVIPHREFQRGAEKRWRNDIAVITLKDEIVRSNVQGWISLPKADTPGNTTATLCGWGLTARNGEESEKLQKIQVTVLNNTECNQKDARIFDNQMCGFDGRERGFCNGDSGGPLVSNDEVIGIVSFAILCGIGYPDSYTRVYRYLDFINGAMSVN